MAYAREESEKLEVSYPLSTLWEAIPKAIQKLDWKIQETDESKHRFIFKTKGAFLSYGSEMEVDLEAIDAETTKLTVGAVTPVTTITAMADYGRTRERIDVFVTTLAKLLESNEPKNQTSKEVSR